MVAPTNSIENCRRNDTERPRCPALPVADEAGHKRVQRSARRKPAPSGEAAAGHRKRIQGSNEKHSTVHELSAGTARINDHLAAQLPKTHVILSGVKRSRRIRFSKE